MADSHTTDPCCQTGRQTGAVSHTGDCQRDPGCPVYQLCLAVCPQGFAALGPRLLLLLVLAESGYLETYQRHLARRLARAGRPQTATERRDYRLADRQND